MVGLAGDDNVLIKILTARIFELLVGILAAVAHLQSEAEEVKDEDEVDEEDEDI